MHGEAHSHYLSQNNEKTIAKEGEGSKEMV
jgi:hypothetical protein